MKEITVENFNCSNVRAWIEDYSHKEKVEFAVYCAELAVDLYTGTSGAPKKAIEAAKVWVSSPTKENKDKCKKAAYAAAATAATAYDAYDAADAAAYAAYAGAATAATAYDAYDAADAAAYAAYAGGKSVKDNIIAYIKNKLIPQTKEVEWKNGDEGLPPVGEVVYGPSFMWQ